MLFDNSKTTPYNHLTNPLIIFHLSLSLSLSNLHHHHASSSYKRRLTLVNSRSASSVSAAPFKIAAYIKNTDSGNPNAVMTAVMGRPSLGFPPESSNSDPVCCFLMLLFVVGII